MNMIKLRRIVQVISLLFFLFLLVVTVYPLSIMGGWVDLYMRLSLLQMLATWLNTGGFIIAFLPAVVLLALTLVLGRFFCGWVCPMGITLDFTDRLIARRGADDSREILKWKRAKYVILLIVLAAAYFEANLAGWLDPLSLITRTYVEVVLPGFEFVTALLFRGLYPVPVLGGAARVFHSFFKTSLYALQQPAFHGMAATALIFLGIALLALFNRRFWCRFICPLGAVFALVSRYSVFKRVVDPDKCIACNKCVKNCRMGAILEGGLSEYRGECVECFTCRDVCPVDAVSFRPVMKGTAQEPVNLSRRGFLWSLGAGLAAVPIVRLSRGGSERVPIRPPGVADIDSFMQKCLRCGQCMRVCPTNGLQPVWTETGIEGLWTPELVPRIGYCEFNCNLCGAVCPSGAIKKLAEDVKQRTVIGLAEIDHDRCIPWTGARNCLVCEEHCPVPDKAIRLRLEIVLDAFGNEVEIKRPYVVQEECIGCGICEARCPVSGPAAIRVTGIMPQELKQRRTEVRERGPAGLLPAAVGGWKATEDVMKFGQDRLYEFINGGSEIYYEYGFESAATREYALGADEMVADVFEMSDPDAAFGIFSNERDPGGVDPGVGDAGSMTFGQLLFCKSSYYVKVNYYGSIDADKALTEFAAAISGFIDDSAGMPEIMSELPPDADVKTAMLVEGPLVMRNFLYMGDTDVAGFSDGARGVIFDSPRGREMLLLYGEESAALKAESSIGEHLKSVGYMEASGSGYNEYGSDAGVVRISELSKGRGAYKLRLSLITK